MRPSIKIALISVGIWFIGKMSFFYTQTFQDPDGVKFLVMWNILCLLMGMTIGIYIEFRAEDRSQSTALQDIRKAMGGGMVYAVLVSLLLFVYYKKIDPAYNEGQRAMMLKRDIEYLNDPAKLAQVKQDPEYKSLSKDEIIDKRRASAEQVFSATSTTMVSMLGMLLLVTINALILTVIFRRLLFRQGTF